MTKKERRRKTFRKAFGVIGVFAVAGFWGIVFTLAVGLKTASVAVAKETAENRRDAKAEDGAMEATAIITPKSPRISDDLTLTITIRHDPALTVERPEFGESYGSFRVERFDVPAPVIEGGRRSDKFILTLVPTESGETPLLPIPIRAVSSENAGNSAGEKTQGVMTMTIPAGMIRIESAFGGKSISLVEITDPQGVKFPPRWNWILGGILFVAAVLTTIFIASRRRRIEREAAIPILSPSQRALAALDRLMESKIYETDVRAFYLELTGIVRRFLEETTGLRAPELTTEEFLETLRRTPPAQLDESIRRELPPFLEFSDLVKFAKFHPSEAEIFDGSAKARRVVETVMKSSEKREADVEEIPRLSVIIDSANEKKEEI